MKKIKIILSILVIIVLLVFAKQNFLNKTIYIDGTIKSIDTTSKYTSISIQSNTKEMYTAIIKDDTYIGNATKSPPKPISFLKKGMSGDFVIKKQMFKYYVSSINIYK